MLKPKETTTGIELPPLNVQAVTLTIIGDTPLITHAWSEKAKKEMLAKQMKRASVGKTAKDPEADFQGSLYPMPGGGYGFPAIAFKAAAVTACTSLGSITKVAARQAFHVVGDTVVNYEGSTPASGELVRILGSEPRMREDMVRVGMGTADLRYRAEFFPWFVKLKVRANLNVLSVEQLANLFNTAGFAVGVGEWRSERDGQNGLFHVGSEEEMMLLMEKPEAVR